MTDTHTRLTAQDLLDLLKSGDASLLARISHPADIAALKLALAAEPLSRALATDVARAQRGNWLQQLRSWWNEAGMPPAFAAAAIAALAIGAFALRAPEHAPTPLATVPGEDSLFVAAFERSDVIFDGEFDRGETGDVMFGGSFDG